MIEVKLYQSSNKEQWDNFILNAKNGHFMFCRDYMDYHSDRFRDHSLMFSIDSELIAILPANISDNMLFSHQGLTFGGVISGSTMTTPTMKNILEALISFLKEQNIKKLIYKSIPYIYYQLPAQEDAYALHVLGAKLYRVDITSTIFKEAQIEFSSRRKRGIKKAQKASLSIVKNSDYESFYLMLSNLLKEKHNTTPTHSVEEMKLLAGRFPQNISLYSAIDPQGLGMAYTMIFEMNHWVHAQYIISSEAGRELGALDLLFDELINKVYSTKKVFDFGISTESQGKVLNNGLITQKEEFGARAVVHNFYELDI
jgi:hypothetical protein